ncbi:hypothetical protein P3X46_018631 [Hevea brasiliensis]|uniref:Uncharacterized protein n=1 Tax=Hevea brasiliensis TaxID=3981 RepID=A0ABQ9LUH2_HEVBR|nr:hypothetical protein P3X46_018631 [Hevea brasiliensis]
MDDMLDLKISRNIDTLGLDVLSDESVSSAVNAIISKCGRVDVLIHNAGVGSTGPLAELDTVRKAWEINTLGQLRLIQKVVPYMASRGSGRYRECCWDGAYRVGRVLLCYGSWCHKVEFWRARASQAAKATNTTVFARHVATKVSSRKPPKQIIFGHITGLFAFLSWSPLWLRDLFFSTRFSVNKRV